MRSGLLWYDADPKTPIEKKIADAAQRYFDRFGVRPDTCFVGDVNIAVNVNDLGVETPDGPKIAIRVKPSILPNHFWLGVTGEPTPEAAP